MVLNCIVFLGIICAIYVYAYPEGQLAATASAIRQIWSGSCRLNCRHSEFSGFSGLSGIITGHEEKFSQAARSSQAGPSSGCVCVSCPCALIENVLRTCRPATTMYSGAVDVVANWYQSLLQMLSDVYSYVERVLNCRVSCQRTPQLIATKDSGSTNIYFGDKKYKQEIEKVVSDGIEKAGTELKAGRSLIFKDVSDTAISTAVTTAVNTVREEVTALSSSKATPDNMPLPMGVSDATLIPYEISGSSSGSDNCPKCSQKGKICMNSCPRSKSKK